jgi:hypothetical protein
MLFGGLTRRTTQGPISVAYLVVLILLGRLVNNPKMEAVRSAEVPITADAPPVRGSHRRFSITMGLIACLETG